MSKKQKTTWRPSCTICVSWHP